MRHAMLGVTRKFLITTPDFAAASDNDGRAGDVIHLFKTLISTMAVYTTSKGVETTISPGLEDGDITLLSNNDGAFKFDKSALSKAR